MSDKIEYSRLIMKRSTVSGDVPTVPPITATTLNDFTPNDIFVGEFFLNAVDDQLWIRTDNGILPIDLSGSTGTTIPTLTQVLFEGNNTGGYNVQVSSGNTINYQGLTTGSTTNFLGLDASGNTIVSGVIPGTPDLQQVLFQGNTTNGYNIIVSSGDTIQFGGLSTGSVLDYLAVDLGGNVIKTQIPTSTGEYLPLSGGTVTGNTYFGITSGITLDQVNNRLGINTNNPQHTVEAFGTKSKITYENTAGGVFQISGDTFLPRINVAGAPSVTKPLFSLSAGVRTWDDVTYPGYGKIGDGFIYASNEMNGLNIINRQGTGTTEDYIRFYAGQDANGTTPDIHIQGSGATRGFVGIGTINPTQPLDVAGNTRVGGNLILRTIGSGTSVINLGLDSSGVVVTGTTGGASVFKAGDGTNTIVADYLATNYAPDQYMLVAGNYSSASSGQFSTVWGGRDNRSTNQFAAVYGGLNNTAGYICGIFGGNGGNADGNTAMIIGGENNTCNNVAWGGIFNGIQNYQSGGNDVGNGIIGGYVNRLVINGGQGNHIIGGRNNRWHQFDSRDPYIGAPRYGMGVMIGGYSNRIEGDTNDSVGAHEYPLILGGTLSKIFGEESNDSATSGATIINSYSSTIYDSLLSAHFETSGSTISGRTKAVMIGTTNRTADSDNTTYTENQRSFGQIYNGYYDNGPGSSFTIDWNRGNSQKITITGDTSLTFTNNKDGAQYRLQVVNAGTHDITGVTASGYSILCEGAAIPNITNNGVDLCVLEVMGEDILVRHFANFA